MTILNDMKIRSLCLTPTHIKPNMSALPYLREHLTIHNDKVYDVATGKERELGYLSDPEIRPVSDEDKRIWPGAFPSPMIAPFEPSQVRTRSVVKDGVEVSEPIISYGTSSMGYDVRLGRKFKIFTNVYNALIDPLSMPSNAYIDHEGDYVIIPPNSYVLGHTLERFHLPRDVVAICVGKSTYARAGCIINVTPVEPGFVGDVVIEIANASPLPMKIHAEMGIAQFMFFRGYACQTSYADRQGKYQNQSGIQTAIV